MVNEFGSNFMCVMNHVRSSFQSQVIFDQFSIQCFYHRFKDNSYQDQINMKSLQQLTNYYSRYRDHFGSASKQHNLTHPLQ